MSSDSEQEPRTDADFAWQERTPQEESSLATSYKPTPCEDAAPKNEIDGDDMISRTPAAALAVPAPRARRTIAVKLDNDDMDFTEAQRFSEVHLLRLQVMSMPL